MSLSFKLGVFIFLWLAIAILPLDLSGKVFVRRNANSRNHLIIGYRGNNYHLGWNHYGSRSSGWPPYYAYYGYPVSNSLYNYSYPINSTFYQSLPSYSRDWIYPSYPYFGTYYINSTPVSASSLRAKQRYAPRFYTQTITTPSSNESISPKGASTSVYFNE